MHIVSYQREGLDTHWFEADDFLILHDLSHYAIERTLGYEKAFWGLIKVGVDPADFEDKARRANIPTSDEAWYAECMANLFLMEAAQGVFEDFNTVFTQSLQTTHPHLPELPLSKEHIEAIRTYFIRLVTEWKALVYGEMMELEF